MSCCLAVHTCRGASSTFASLPARSLALLAIPDMCLVVQVSKLNVKHHRSQVASEDGTARSNLVKTRTSGFTLPGACDFAPPHPSGTNPRPPIAMNFDRPVGARAARPGAAWAREVYENSTVEAREGGVDRHPSPAVLLPPLPIDSMRAAAGAARALGTSADVLGLHCASSNVLSEDQPSERRSRA